MWSKTLTSLAILKDFSKRMNNGGIAVIFIDLKITVMSTSVLTGDLEGALAGCIAPPYFVMDYNIPPKI